jgi:hypothetical protein
VSFFYNKLIDMAAPSPALDPHPDFSEIQKNLKLFLAEIFDDVEDYARRGNARFGIPTEAFSIDESLEEGFQPLVVDKLAELDSRHYTTVFKYLIDYVTPLISHRTKKDVNVFFAFLNLLKTKMTDEEYNSLRVPIQDLVIHVVGTFLYIPVYEIAKFIIDALPLINRDDSKQRIKRWAVREGYLDILTKLGGEFNCETNEYQTKYAIRHGHIDVVQYLLEQGCNPTKMLEIAMEINDEKTKTLIPILLQAGAKRDVIDKKITELLSKNNSKLENFEKLLASNIITQKLRESLGNSPSHEMPTNAFLVSAHGSESRIRVEDRFVLPPGVWVVSFEQCGQLLGVKQSQVADPYRGDASFDDSGISAFLQPNNPKAREYLHKRLNFPYFRVHGPGSRCPHSYLYFPADFASPVSSVEPTHYGIQRSGITKLPVPSRNDPLTDRDVQLFPLSGITESNLEAKMLEFENVLRNAFKHSIFPTPEMAVDDFRQALDEELEGEEPDARTFTNYVSSFAPRMRYFIGDLIAKMGKGVYYLQTCRAVAQSDGSMLEKIRRNSNAGLLNVERLMAAAGAAAGGAGAGAAAAGGVGAGAETAAAGGAGTGRPRKSTLKGGRRRCRRTRRHRR